MNVNQHLRRIFKWNALIKSRPHFRINLIGIKRMSIQPVIAPRARFNIKSLLAIPVDKLCPVRHSGISGLNVAVKINGGVL